MKYALLALGLMFFGASVFGGSVHALGLKVAPLEYRSSLKSGELKKGFIDISNPENEKVVVRTSVQAMRQIDNSGTLEFYDDDQINKGLKLDLTDFELGPREAIRMYFLLDSKLLPSGDIFAGIFFTTEPTKATQGTGQSVKLGTLLSIVNGTQGSRNAEITALSLPSFVMGDTISGTYRIKNTGDPATSTGFYPEVRVKVWPWGSDRSVKSSLVFAGRSRDNSFSLKAPLLGVYKVSASFGESAQSKWVIVAHSLALTILGIATLVFVALLRLYRRRGNNKKPPFVSR